MAKTSLWSQTGLDAEASPGLTLPPQNHGIASFAKLLETAVYTPHFHGPRSLGAHGSAGLSSHSQTFGVSLWTELGRHHHPTRDDGGGHPPFSPSHPHPPGNPPLSLWFYRLTAPDLG